jgi:CubicO group peptidase (beta-lactamase class C family)
MEGLIAPGFEALADAFAVDPRGGSALTVLRHGRPVVEVFEGWRDDAHTVPWDAATLVNVYSVGKPIIAAAVMILVGRGLIDLPAPMSAYWPSFQGQISVREVLTHTAGLPVFPVERPATAWSDWDLLCADLAAATPEWEPGTAVAEHALTYGHLLGELVRRVDGRMPAEFVASEIGPNLLYGLSPADQARCADLCFDDPSWPVRNAGEPGSLKSRAIANPAGARDLTVVNSPLWREATVPAVNLHTTATAVARFYADLVDGRFPALAVTAYTGNDLFIGDTVTWGYGVQFEADGTWGMGGLGGNAGWADPGRGLTIGYVTRRLGDFAAVDRIENAIGLLKSA